MWQDTVQSGRMSSGRAGIRALGRDRGTGCCEARQTKLNSREGQDLQQGEFRRQQHHQSGETSMLAMQVLDGDERQWLATQFLESGRQQLTKVFELAHGETSSEEVEDDKEEAQKRRGERRKKRRKKKEEAKAEPKKKKEQTEQEKEPVEM